MFCAFNSYCTKATEVQSLWSFPDLNLYRNPNSRSCSLVIWRRKFPGVTVRELSIVNATPMKREHQSECNGCGSDERFFLFNVRHRAAFRRLCTSCVLKFHPNSFCPICFEVYDEPPPPHERVMCVKCPSISHLACIGFQIPPRYECPPCANPSFMFFHSSLSNKKIKVANGESEVPLSVDSKTIDKDSAKVLVAAARIASVSMSKAATVARVEAERRVKEAALARKRARESLERVAYLTLKYKDFSQVSKGADHKNHTGADRIDMPVGDLAFSGGNSLAGEEKVKGFRSSDNKLLGPTKNGVPIEGNR